MHKAWDRNDGVRLTTTFKNFDGVLTDPTTISFLYKKADSDSTITKVFGVDAEVKKTSTGIYYIVLDLDVEGIWRWRWEGTGVVVASDEGTLAVKDSQFYAA